MRKLLMKIKMYWTRSNGYLALINSAMILYLFLSKLKEIGYINWDIGSYLIGIIVVGMALLIGIGYLEVEKIKGYTDEAEFTWSKIPQVNEINDRLKRIEGKLNE